MRTTLNIDDTLIRKAKQRALDRHTTLTRVIEDALTKELATPPQPKAAFGLRLFPDARPSPVDVANRSELCDLFDESEEGSPP